MKTSVRNNNQAGNARYWAFLLTGIFLLAANLIPAMGAPAQNIHKKDGGVWTMAHWLGGWAGTGGPERLYFWLECPQANTVTKQTADGLFWVDSCTRGTAVIATAGETGDFKTKPQAENIRYVGVCTVVDAGLWVLGPDGWFDVAGKETWTIKATVTDVITGEEWELYWHLVLRGEEWDENYSFAPVE